MKRITDHSHDKYITTPEFNKLTADRKITQNKTKHMIVENESKKSETFDLIYFCGKSHFEDDGTIG